MCMVFYLTRFQKWNHILTSEAAVSFLKAAGEWLLLISYLYNIYTY